MTVSATVVVPTHNRANDLRATLHHLSDQDFIDPWEVIVVANACTDDTVGVLAEFPGVRCVTDEVPSAPRARNLGLAAAAGEIVIFLDDDVRPMPDFVRRHVEAVHRHDACIVGHSASRPGLELTPFGRFHLYLYPNQPPGVVREVTWYASGNASMWTRLLREVGGYNEAIVSSGMEDVELASKLSAVGTRIVFDSSIVGVHYDWAAESIDAYCDRQRRYAHTAADVRPETVRAASRLSRQLIAARPVQLLLREATTVAERRAFPPLLFAIYQARLAAAVAQGVREAASPALKSG